MIRPTCQPLPLSSCSEQFAASVPAVQPLGDFLCLQAPGLPGLGPLSGTALGLSIRDVSILLSTPYPPPPSEICLYVSRPEELMVSSP